VLLAAASTAIHKFKGQKSIYLHKRMTGEPSIHNIEWK